MRFLVVGGLGYLGSIISDKLIAEGHVVDIFDLCLFDNADVTRDFHRPIPDKIGTITRTFDGCYDLLKNKYDKIIWCSNIDIEGFYDNFMDHNRKTLRLFDLMVETNKMILCLSSKSKEMDKMDVVTRYMCEKNGGSVIYWIPELYGPSLRMRWDTLINRIILCAIVEKTIQIDSNWMQKICMMRVASMADIIIETAVENKITRFEDFIEGQFSILELCFMIKSFLDSSEDTINIQLSSLDIDALDTSVIQLGNLEYLDSLYMFKKTVLNIKEQLTNGALPDFLNDKYNNEAVLLPLIKNLKVLEKING